MRTPIPAHMPTSLIQAHQVQQEFRNERKELRRQLRDEAKIVDPIFERTESGSLAGTGGRPPFVMDQKTVDLILQALRSNSTRAAAAAIAGIRPETFSRAMKQQEEPWLSFQQVVLTAEAHGEVTQTMQMNTHSKQNVEATKFLLERRHGWKKDPADHRTLIVNTPGQGGMTTDGQIDLASMLTRLHDRASGNGGQMPRDPRPARLLPPVVDDQRAE